MKNLLRTEEIAFFILSLVAWHISGFSWSLFLILFLAPDLSMLGYLAGPVPGARIYNLVHHRGIAVTVYLYGLYAHHPPFEIAGLILFSHATFDRIFGYGLKFKDGFHHTHLGMIGRFKNKTE